MKSGNILKEIWLNKENVDKVYYEVSRLDIKHINDFLMKLLKKFEFNQNWIEDYRKDMIKYLETKHKPNNLFPYEFAKELLKVLQIIDDGQENLKRVLSMKCFGDSKYFEKNIEHILVRIIKKHLLENDYPEEYNNDDVLLQVRNFKISRSNRMLW